MDTTRKSEQTPMKHPTTVERKSDREVVITRTINGPPRLVFQAWSTAALFAQWWVPKSAGLNLLSCEMDVRVGGSYRLVFQLEGDQTMAFFGRYLEVVPDARIVWTNDEQGEGNGALSTVTFEAHGATTRVTLSDVYPSKEALEAGLGSYDGMGETFDQLDALLSA